MSISSSSARPDSQILLGDQPLVFAKLTKFIDTNYHDDAKIFRLVGSAGTGKSTVIAKFTMEIVTKNNKKKIYILAPTNKAVKVLKEKTNYTDNKNIQFLTIDKFINCIERIDQLGRTYFCPKGLRAINVKDKLFYIDDTDDFTRINKIRRDIDLQENPFKYCSKHLDNICEDDLIIIDECSMLNDNKWYLIKHLTNCKIICMGDKYQLDPIETNKVAETSAIFSEDINPEYDCEMTTILRTDDSVIHKIYQETRNMIDMHLPFPDVYNILKGCNINKTGMKDVLIKNIKKDLENNRDIVVLSYKNYAVNNFSNIIHECLEDTKTKQYGYFLNTKYVMKSHYNKLITNNTEFEIKSVVKEDDVYILKILTDENESHEIHVFEKSHHEKITSELYTKSAQLKRYNNTKSIAEKNKLQQLAKSVIGKDESILASYSDNIEGALIKLKQDARNCMAKGDEIFCLAYSLTIHKSQGSQYMKVYISVRDIYDTKPITLRDKAKLLYVAASRASQEIMFYI